MRRTSAESSDAAALNSSNREKRNSGSGTAEDEEGEEMTTLQSVIPEGSFASSSGDFVLSDDEIGGPPKMQVKKSLYAERKAVERVVASRCQEIHHTLRRFPNPLHVETSVSTRFVHASVVSERLHTYLSVADERVFVLAQQYLATHKQQHKFLTKQHWLRGESAIYQIPRFAPRWEMILAEPLKTTAGRFVVALEAVLATWTAIQLMVETVPQYNSDVNPHMEPIWFTLELISTVFFASLAAFRFAVLSNKREYLRSFTNLTDLLTIAPFFIQLGVDDRRYNVLKVLRIVRFVRPFRGFPNVEAINITLKKIATSLIAPYTLLATSVLIFGCIVYWAEGGQFVESYTNPLTNVTLHNTFLQEDCLCTSTAAHDFGNATCPQLPALFPSIIQAMWFCAVAFTTVGYGDVVPRCLGGKVITSVGLLFSTVFIAMPIAIIGTSFTETVIQQEREQTRRKQAKAQSIWRNRLNEQLNVAITGRVERRGNHNGGKAASLTAGDGLCRHIASVIGRQTVRLAELAWIAPPGIDVDVERFHRDGIAVTKQLALVSDISRVPSMSGSGSADESSFLMMGVDSVAHAGGPGLTELQSIGERMETSRLPCAARFHSAVVHAADSYVGYMMEAWACDWLQEQSEGVQTEQGRGIQHQSSPLPARMVSLGSRDGAHQRQLQLAIAAQQQELIQWLAGKHPVIMIIPVGVGDPRLSSARFGGRAKGGANAVHTRERDLGLAAQALVRSRVSLDIVAVPPAPKKQPQNQALRVEQTSGRDRFSNLRAAAIAGRRMNVGRGFKEETQQQTTVGTADGYDDGKWGGEEALNIYCEELMQAGALGCIEVLDSFAQRLVRFVPYDLLFTSHLINGVPIEEVAARQHILRSASLGAPGGTQSLGPFTSVDWNALKLRQLVTATISEIKAQALLADLHPLSCYAGGAGGSSAKGTLLDRAFSVTLQDGDEITFSSLVKLQDEAVASSATKGGAVEKLIQNYLSAMNLPADTPISAEMKAALLSSRAAQLSTLGIKPVTYKVIIPDDAVPHSNDKIDTKTKPGVADAGGGSGARKATTIVPERLLEEILGDGPSGGRGESRSAVTGNTSDSTPLAPVLPPDSGASARGAASPLTAVSPLRSALKRGSSGAARAPARVTL
jgi:voltage-gated potassium channel